MTGRAAGTASRLAVPREAALSFVINAGLSLAFFLALFGTRPRLLTLSEPDGLAFDFVPQSIAVALMSALVPALLARRRLAGVRQVPGATAILARALAMAVAGAALGGVLAWAALSAGIGPVAWGAALIGKLLYGGVLGALVCVITLTLTFGGTR